MKSERQKWRVWMNPETGEPTEYEASNKGRIRNGDHHIMSPTTNNTGYKLVHLTINGKSRLMPVHRMVGECWCVNPNPQVCTELDHINRKKDDNRAVNLRWVTHAENMSNTQYNGIRMVDCYDLNDIYITTFRNVSEAGRAVGLTAVQGVRACCDGYQDSAGGYRFKWKTSEYEQLYLF